MFVSGFEKIAEISEEDKSTLKKGALIGVGAGAVKNLAWSRFLDKREESIPNTRQHSKFLKKLKPGDILIAGSSPKHSGAVTIGDLPNFLAKPLKALGGKNSSRLLTNSSLLNVAGAGSKYHGAVYLGKGRVGHMTTDVGAASEKITDALAGQNVTAYRLSKGSDKNRQIDSAVKFTKQSIKKKIPYEGPLEYIKEPIKNLIVPDLATKACRKTKNGMVCHTLPLMAYSKQKFSQGRRTYSGDIRRNLNFQPVARRDIVKLSPITKIKGILGQVGKGAAYALPGAALAYGYHKYKQKTEKK